MILFIILEHSREMYELVVEPDTQEDLESSQYNIPVDTVKALIRTTLM